MCTALLLGPRLTNSVKEKESRKRSLQKPGLGIEQFNHESGPRPSMGMKRAHITIPNTLRVLVELTGPDGPAGCAAVVLWFEQTNSR